jgi:mercuric ion transport protein
MDDRALMRTGVVVAVVAAICCATPLLAVVFGTVGLSALAAKADYIAVPALVLCLGLVGWALILRRKQKENS